MEQEYYKILGIAKTATPGEVKKAYLKLARENHPDRFRDPEERAEADRRFQLITEAYNHLRDDKLRKEYDRTLDRKVRPPDEEARLYFKNGEFREQSKDWENALKLYYEAMRLQPDNLEYIVAAGRVLSLDKSKQRQASELFEQAIAKDAKAPEAYLLLGSLYMRSKMFLRAKRVYENALKQIPHHPELRRQLAESEAAEKKSRSRGR